MSFGNISLQDGLRFAFCKQGPAGSRVIGEPMFAATAATPLPTQAKPQVMYASNCATRTFLGWCTRPLFQLPGRQFGLKICPRFIFAQKRVIIQLVHGNELREHFLTGRLTLRLLQAGTSGFEGDWGADVCRHRCHATSDPSKTASYVCLQLRYTDLPWMVHASPFSIAGAPIRS